MNAAASRLEVAVQHHRAGQLSEAERLYRSIIADEPGHANAMFLLGLIAMLRGRLEEAATLFGQAAAIDPRNAAFHANLGEAYRRLGRFDESLGALTRAMSLQSDLVEPVFNLGMLLQEHGDLDGAIACFEWASQVRPNMPQINAQLSAAAKARDVRSVSARAPARATSARALAKLGYTLAIRGRNGEATHLSRRAIELDPRLAAAHVNVGVLQLERWEVDEAIASFHSALRIEPQNAVALCSLGNASMKQGVTAEAVAYYRRAVAAGPELPAIQSNLLFALHFDPAYSATDILREARAWERQHALPLNAEIAPHPNDRTSDRRLRIGYVSPDFRDHCQSFFTIPLLNHHDHARFEVFCYSTATQSDRFTERLCGYADVWCDISTLSDETAAQRIRGDRIDILVDLSMHMDGNRLSLFARKPAPIQVTWLAYPGTTGLSAIDYRISDPYLDSPESSCDVYAEQTLRLPNTFWCYDPLTTEPQVSPLPAREAGFIRFGCLNGVYKINPRVIGLWGRVLRAVERSRLVLGVPAGAARERILAAFGEHGIDSARIEFAPHLSRAQYLALYQFIDVCLDTFPYGGHTTSLDALWMGVPVVTLVGDTVVGRAGLCHATNLGLTELVARGHDDYVAIASDLCANLDRLGELRAGLRARMERSPLMDAPRFARDLEAAYRDIWRRWCERGVLPPPT